MLGILFLLVWITVIAALTSHERHGRLRLQPDATADDVRGLLGARQDHSTLARYYQLALQRGMPKRPTQLLRINYACALNGMHDHQRALDELDRIDLRELTVPESALWMNNRAYTLIFLGRIPDALEHLNDAEELLVFEHNDHPEPLLMSCVSSTRGLAHLQAGDLDAAEAALRLALQQEEEGVTLRFDPEWQVDVARTAERWYWLGEVAKRRGDLSEAVRRYNRAASEPQTEYGARALQSLEALQGSAAADPGAHAA